MLLSPSEIRKDLGNAKSVRKIIMALNSPQRVRLPFSINSHVARGIIRVEACSQDRGHALITLVPSIHVADPIKTPTNQPTNQGAIHKAGCYEVVSHSSPNQPH